MHNPKLLNIRMVLLPTVCLTYVNTVVRYTISYTFFSNMKSEWHLLENFQAVPLQVRWVSRIASLEYSRMKHQ